MKLEMMNLAAAAALAMGMAVGTARAAEKDIVDTAVAAGDFETLAAALTASGLVDTLKGTGPYTVFAPTDDAFAKLPAGTVDTLLKPENKKTLTDVLTYHVVSGRMSAKDLTDKVKAGNGKAMLKTVEGKDLTFAMKDGKLWVWDAKGGSAQITIQNVNQSNGVIHVVDTVLLPG